MPARVGTLVTAAFKNSAISTEIENIYSLVPIQPSDHPLPIIAIVNILNVQSVAKQRVVALRNPYES